MMPATTIADSKREPVVHYPVRADVSRPLAEIIADLERNRVPYRTEEFKLGEIPNRFVPGKLSTLPPLAPTPEQNVQRNMPADARVPTTGVSFDGYTGADNVTLFGGNPAPPDTNGDVGVDYYIHYNNIGWKIFNKSDGSVFAGPFAGNTFWSGFGGVCENQNAGDPIVLYDRFAQRWFFAQFASPVSAGGTQCIAVSQTSDPMGPYNRYEYAINGLDYPKMGVWTDGGDNSAYTLITNNFPNGGGYAATTIAVLDRDAALNGDLNAPIVRFDLAPTATDAFFATMPGNLEGANIPPAGTCVPFVQTFDEDVWGSAVLMTDGFQISEICPDFTTPANSVLTGPNFVAATTDWSNALCGFNPCIEQPGTAQTLDHLTQFTMYQANFVYSPVSAPGELRVVMSSTADVGSDTAGVQWAELAVTAGANATVIQEGVFAPADGDSRWIPSAAMDQAGNIGIVYSKSSSSTFPSVYYSGRLVSDTPGQLQTEEACVDGGGSQTGVERWGDYASMNIDPVDNCTFWMTHEYYSSDSSRDWDTRVCSFVFPSCITPQVIINVTANQEQTVCAGDPLNAIDLEASISTGETDAIDLSLMNVPAGFTAMVSPTTINPNPGTAQITGTVGGAVSAGDYSFDVSGSTLAMGIADGSATLDVTVFDAVPGAPTLVGPVDGLLDASLTPTFEWSAVADSLSYLIEVDDNSDFSSPEIMQSVTGTTFTAGTPLSASTEYFWRVTAANSCGDSSASATRSFTTFAPSDSLVLLVDDDDNSPDVRSFYTAALDAAGIPYDLFDTNVSTVEPDAMTLDPYAAVVWFSGDEFSFGSPQAGPGAAAEAALGTYLDAGGCFFLSSQDYFFDAGLTTFNQTYLGLSAGTSDVSQTQVTGQGLFSALGTITLDYGSAGLSNFSDELTPDGTAAVAFDGDQGTAAISKDDGNFLTAFLGFSLPAVPTAADRTAALDAFLVGGCDIFAGAPVGSITGTITIAGTATPIAGAIVTANRGGVERTAVADAGGVYTFPNLQAGFYQLQASAPNAVSSPVADNVQVTAAMATTQDFALAAGALSYDSAVLVVDLTDPTTRDTRTLTLSNPGALPIAYTLDVVGYDLGLPAGSMTPILSGHGGNVGRQTSFGPMAALEATVQTAAPKAAGDVLFSAPFSPGSPLGITQAPDGTVYVADLFSGETVIYDENLNELVTILDPIGEQLGAGATSGIAYDTVNDTLWWINDFGNGTADLVEGFTDGTATGNTIPLTISATGLAAGVEYSPLLDAFFYVDIGADDIYAVDRSGNVLVGYPAPQTDYDDGSGLFGNGLDVRGNQLEVLVGLSADGQASRGVLTDRFGNNLGLETSLTATGDTFMNDITRSRILPDEIMYVVGNSTNTIFAVDPQDLVLATQWATPSTFSGNIPDGGSEDLVIDFDSAGLPAGEYQATLVFEGTFANTAPGKPLGLVVNRFTPQPASGLVVTEAGGTAQFTLALGLRPDSDVVIPVASSDLGEGTVDVNVLRFDATNWDQPQTVTITGVDDTQADGDQSFTIVLGETESADPQFDGADPTDVSVTNQDDDVASIIVMPTSGLITTEAGGTAQFTVVLSDQPTDDVTISVASDTSGEGTSDASSLTFTAGDFDQPQAVTVTGVDDGADDGDVPYSIVLGVASSADTRYDGLDADDVSLTNQDNDAGMIDVNPTAGLQTDETGVTAQFTVVLSTQPSADVFVSVASSDGGEGTVDTGLLTFTSADWDQPQTVTVIGVDDSVVDGDQAYTILLGAASSADGNFDGIDPPDVSVTNADDDFVGGVTVAPTAGLEVNEGGTTAQFTVVLDAQPTANVFIPVSSSDAGEGTVDPSLLTFTPANWDQPRPVTVTGVDDTEIDGDIGFTILLEAASSADANFNGVDPADVSVTNMDDEVPSEEIFADGFEEEG